MSDLISRQALCQYALNQKDKSVTPNDIMRFPSADAVEVVRCKDCNMTRMRDSYSRGNWCIIHRDFMQDDYFCADGVRMEGESDE